MVPDEYKAPIVKVHGCRIAIVVTYMMVPPTLETLVFQKS